MMPMLVCGKILSIGLAYAAIGDVFLQHLLEFEKFFVRIGHFPLELRVEDLGRKEFLQVVLPRAGNVTPDSFDIFRRKQGFDDGRSKLVGEAAVSQSVDTLPYGIGIDGASRNAVVDGEWCLDVHGDVLDEPFSYRFFEELRIGAVGVELYQESELFDAPDKIEKLVAVHRRLAARYHQAVKHPAARFQKRKNERLGERLFYRFIDQLGIVAVGAAEIASDGIDHGSRLPRIIDERAGSEPAEGHTLAEAAFCACSTL